MPVCFTFLFLFPFSGKQIARKDLKILFRSESKKHQIKKAQIKKGAMERQWQLFRESRSWKVW